MQQWRVARNVSQIDISDYVSGRLDALDRFRFEAALASDLILQRAVKRARMVDNEIKSKFGLRTRPGCSPKG